MKPISLQGWLLAGLLILSALIGAAAFAGIQALVPAIGGDKARTEALVRAYILDHGEILPQAMDRLQAKQVAEAVARSPDVAKPFAGAWTGNPNGDVTLVAFMDYNCGYCRASLPAVAELLKRDPKVRVVYREYPVLGDDSVTAARWALAAAEQGKFPAFHDAMFAGGRISSQSIAAAAAKAGLDQGRAAAAIAAAPVTREIANNHRYGQQLGMTGTPSWIIGDKVMQGAQTYDMLAAAVADARKGK
jgi:protein-disulfide isomerase